MTTTMQDTWVIRPTNISGSRRYFAVAVLASGEEVVLSPGGVSFATVQAARQFIVSRFDGGRRFPKPVQPFAYSDGYFANMDAIRNRHRVAC